jgi:hypothetical protein
MREGQQNKTEDLILSGEYWKLIIQRAGKKPLVFSGGGHIEEMYEDELIINAIGVAVYPKRVWVNTPISNLSEEKK